MNRTPWTTILHHFGIFHYRVSHFSGDIIVKCVMHQERTPSLRLYQNSGLGKCYGCGWAPSKHDFIKFLSRNDEEDPLLAECSYLDNHFYTDDQPLFPFMENGWDLYGR
jgi:hypothetical protein